MTTDPGLRTPRAASCRSFRACRILALIICLFAPSAWLLATVHPLWRDSDAYNQLTQHPAFATYVGHGPLYCVAARVPLYIGYRLENAAASERIGAGEFFEQARLTDTGVLLLISAQHLALSIAACWLIVSATRRFSVRFLLAVLFASNPIFYTFAHCVGSETLSMILIIVLATTGLRIVERSAEPPWTSWYLFAIALYLCLLTRHVNLLLVLLLPLAFLLSAWQSRARAHFRLAIIALLIGISCFAVARHSTRQLCNRGKLEYHSRFGFTFLWRLRFLAEMPEPARTGLLDRVSARTTSPDAQNSSQCCGGC